MVIYDSKPVYDTSRTNTEKGTEAIISAVTYIEK